MSIYYQDYSKKYCTYITCYRGNKLPPYYIGYSTTHKVLYKKYRGTVSSKKYQLIWKEELLNNPHLFKTYILTTHDSQREAIQKEAYFQMYQYVYKNPMFINRAIGNKFIAKDVVSKETRAKQSRAAKGRKHSEESKIKMSLTQSNRSLEHRKKLGKSTKNRKISEQTRRKMSESAKKKPKITPETRQRLKQASANRDPSVFKKISNSNKGRIKTEIEKENIRKSKQKIHKFLNSSGNIVEIHNLKQFCKDENLTYSCMARVSRGDRLSHRNWFHC